MTIQTQFKTKNQIYKDFKTFTETALTDFGLKNWSVKKLHQIIKTEELKPTVFIQILSKRQYGSEYRFNLKVSEPLKDTQYNKKYNTKQVVNIRFSATRRELITDTAQTFNGVDVLTLIRQYFQSLNGITMFSNQGYAQYRATNVQEQSFTNDDENIQLMPYFDCEFVYTDSWQTQINKLETVIEIYKKGV